VKSGLTSIKSLHSQSVPEEDQQEALANFFFSPRHKKGRVQEAFVLDLFSHLHILYAIFSVGNPWFSALGNVDGAVSEGDGTNI
jgi:hypothetical protein